MEFSEMKDQESLFKFVEYMAGLQEMSAAKIIMPARYIAANGRHYPNKGLTPKDMIGKQKLCFHNSFQIAISRTPLMYVEGYAYHENVPFPVEHAWCVDEQGNVFDPTWGNQGTGYFGVPIDEQKLMKIALITKYYGVFGPAGMSKWEQILEILREK